mmetsp:Transcript_5282/g.9926  ORF Transcript_5282/g.9926 Transcript_5282/m.9926 type:complete len:307 (+) Transcript_5282:208-1128(+)
MGRKPISMPRPGGARTDLVWAFRVATVVMGALAWCYKAELDIITEQAYQMCRESWIFRHDSFEPVVATLSFGLWIHWFAFVDDVLPLKQYLMEPNRVKDRYTGVPQKVAALYLSVLFVFDWFYPRRRLPEEGPGSFFKVVTDIASGLFVYDLLFFPIHLAMHKVSFLRKFHVKHHEAKALFSTEVLRHSIVDGSCQVMVNIATLNLLKMHPFSRAIYNVVVTYWLTSTHSGYDLPCMLHNIVPFNLIGGSVRHEEHHREGRRHFQQFFTYLDDILLPVATTGVRFDDLKKQVPTTLQGYLSKLHSS